MEEERIRKKKTRYPFHLPPPLPHHSSPFPTHAHKEFHEFFFFFLFFHQWPNTFCRFRFDNFISDGGWNRKEKKIKKIKKIKKERGKKKTNKQKKKKTRKKFSISHAPAMLGDRWRSTTSLAIDSPSDDIETSIKRSKKKKKRGLE